MTQIERIARELANQDCDACFDEPTEFSAGACDYYRGRAKKIIAAAGRPNHKSSDIWFDFALGGFIAVVPIAYLDNPFAWYVGPLVFLIIAILLWSVGR